jgi:hypothetical protein
MAAAVSTVRVELTGVKANAGKYQYGIDNRALVYPLGTTHHWIRLLCPHLPAPESCSHLICPSVHRKSTRTCKRERGNSQSLISSHGAKR